MPADGPGGVRHGGDASPVCGFCMEREKAGCDTARSGLRAGEREKPVRCMGVSTVAGSAGMLGLQIPRIRSHQVRCGCPAAQLIAEAQRAAGSARAGRTRPISPAPRFSARPTWLLLGALENVSHNGSLSRPLAIGFTRKRGPGGRWRCVTRRDEPRPSHAGSRVRVVTAVTVSQSGLRRPTPDKACAMGTWT